jgi:hypothetical protein
MDHSIKMEVRDTGYDVGTDSGSCPVAGFGISHFKPSGSAIIALVT